MNNYQYTMTPKERFLNCADVPARPPDVQRRDRPVGADRRSLDSRQAAPADLDAMLISGSEYFQLDGCGGYIRDFMGR